MSLRLVRRFDAHDTRAITGFVLAVALWSVFIECFVDGLSKSPEPVRPLTLDARLVEIAPPPPPPAQPAPAVPPTAARPVPHLAAPARPTHVVRPMVPVPSPLPARSESPAPSPVAEPPATTESRSSATETSDTSSSSSTGPSAGTSSGASSNASAHPILQPLPVLPDDLRESAYQAVALARFTIHPDGSVDVALVRPTQNPRLNQLLLETLRNWRFFPALKDGHPVESEQDIRVHFNVG